MLARKTKEDAKNFEDGFYPIRDCSMCKNDIGYKIIDGEIFFDSNCFCISYTTPPEKRSKAEFCKQFDVEYEPELMKNHLVEIIMQDIEANILNIQKIIFSNKEGIEEFFAVGKAFDLGFFGVASVIELQFQGEF